MTASRTPSQRGASNRRKGLIAERDLCRWLRVNGFPGAERAVRTGFRTGDRVGADPGDVTGTPGVVWSVKDCAVEEQAKWRAELDAMLDAHWDAAAVGLIVHKRRGHGDVGSWWCWITITDLTAILPLSATFHGPQWFRATVGEIVPLLRAAGYGSPAEVAS